MATKITLETQHTAHAAQTIATEVLGWNPGVSTAGRLGTEITIVDPPKDKLDELRRALRAGGRRVWTTREKA